MSGGSLWSQNGANIFYNTGKVAIGKDPGGDLRQFQVLGGSNIAVVAENSSASYASLYASNSTSGGLAAQFENAAGPVARFGSNIIISDGTQGLGKVLTSDANGATSWQTPASNPWQTAGSNIYYNAGWVGIGTSSISHPLTIENNNNTCYIRLKDNEGSGGMRIGAYTGELAFLNDNVDENIRFSVKTSSGYEQMLTLKASDQKVGINVTTPTYNLSVLGTSVTDISIHSPGTGTGSDDGLRIGVSNSGTANAWVWNNENGDLYFGTNDVERMRITAAGNVGIGDTSPDATLDVEGTAIIDGTLKIGSSGKVFSELREITGTTGAAGGSTTISYPSGYNMTNIRVLSLEINYNGNAWVGLGANENNTSVNTRVFYYLGSSNIMIYYSGISHFQSRAFRMMVMKVQ